MMNDFGQEKVDAIASLVNDMLDDVHTSSSAKFEEVKDNFSADITPNLNILTDDGRKIPYPKLPGVQILMPCGSDGSIGFAFPVKSGDGCIALYGEGGSGSDYKHDLSNAIALPGLSKSSSEKVKKAGDEDAAIMFAKDTIIMVKEDEIQLKQGNIRVSIKDGAVKVTNGATSLSVSSSGVDINSKNVNVTASNISMTGNVSITGLLTLAGINMNTHTHPTPVGPSGTPM